MNAHNIQVRIAGIAICLIAIAASLLVAGHLKPGSGAGAAEVESCAICMPSGGVSGSGGTVGRPVGPSVNGGVGGSASK